MRTTTFVGFALSKWSRAVGVVIFGCVVLFLAIRPSAQTADPSLKVLKVGLGLGTITSTDGSINCGTTCNADYPTARTVELIATPDATDGFSRFSRWIGDCTVTTAPDRCSVNATAAVQWVKAEFVLTTSTGSVVPLTDADLVPEGPPGMEAMGGLKRYLNAHPEVNSPARFIAALPPEYRENWILMTRSESLQTGTADSPRILLPSATGHRVFTVGMTRSSSYPGSDPNAIEYMQYDPVQKNFRFHEIIVAPPLRPIPALGDTILLMDGVTRVPVFPERARKVSVDDTKCSKCHSTRNVLSTDRTGPSAVPGTAGGTDIVPPDTLVPPTSVMAKNKPNWDTYDSWGGMLPFNRDRIFQGSIEAAAFRKIFNLWNWNTNDAVRSVLEQLKLQPDSIPAEDSITRTPTGAEEGHINFFFDHGATITREPLPVGSPPFEITYSFNRVPGPSSGGTEITRGGESVMMRHAGDLFSTGPNAEGRGVQLFDFVGGADGSLNQSRIVDELSTHRYAPGSVQIDVRPIALAIAKPCFVISGDDVNALDGTRAIDPALLSFFRNRNGGLTLSGMYNDTLQRERSIPRRKADLERLNLDRMQFDGSFDPYLATSPRPAGLLQLYSGDTSLTLTGVDRLRQEVFRRPPEGGFRPDEVIGRIYVDREDYVNGRFNTERMTLYRYFLEPLGVSVDKWSMGVRGRSRTYSFADVLNDSTYDDTFRDELQRSLSTDRFRTPTMTLTSFECGDLIPVVNELIRPLPSDGGGPVPKYTDVQRIFNKSCIECHGGLLYPPYGNIVSRDPVSGTVSSFGHFDLSEEEYPLREGRTRRMRRSWTNAVSRISMPIEMSQLYGRINASPTDSENCPGHFMPCGGPWLTPADINTIYRWIRGGAAYSEGDPHLRTVDGVNYDFQSAGEFVLLRDESIEIQTRQIAIDTGGPLGPNEHTGLSSCVSINGAIAVGVDGHRITYQPNLSGVPDPSGMQLRIDGKLTTLGAEGIPVSSGVRVMQTNAPGGIRIESAGGSAIIITPRFWDYWQVWQTDIHLVQARGTEGLMGNIAPGSWLPALPDGSSLGPRPGDLHQRYVDLYERFESAWRVTDANTLFDYAPGTSTRNFTIESWPIENPQTCQVPRPKQAPAPRTPLEALPLTAAQQACAGIAADDRKSNCIKDVMVTGDTNFATTYVLADQILRNASPTAPTLTSPQDYYDNNKTDIALPVTFTWTTATDPDGDPVSYRHCVWVMGQLPDNNKCELTPVKGTARQKAAFWASLLLLVLLLLLLLFLLLVRRQRKPGVLIVLAIAVLASGFVAIYLYRTRTRPATVAKTTQLEAGKDYSWKVIAEDGKGGISESETRRFKTR